MKFSKKLSVLLTTFVVAMLVAEPALAQTTPDLWDRIKAVTTGVAALKALLIVGAFIAGLFYVIKASVGITKLVDEDRGPTKETWVSVTLKMLGGVFLLVVTLTSDMASQTIFGKTVSSQSSTSINLN